MEFLASQNYRGDLRAAPGYIFCLGWKELGKGKAKTITILDYPGKTPIDDGPLVKEIAKILADADMYIYHFGDKCDWKFVQTRLVRHGYLPLNKSSSFDTCSVASKYLSIKSNSLKSLAYFFGLKESKMEIPQDIWLLANTGDKKSINKIASRCRSDVRLTEEVYKKELPLAANHPALHHLERAKERRYYDVPDRCRACSSTKFQSRGFVLNGDTVRKRYNCSRCAVPHYVVVKKVKTKQP